MARLFVTKCSDNEESRHAAAWRLLYEAVKETYSIEEDELVIGRTPEGKPFFSNRPEVFFSLSHSGEYAVCALDDSEIGVDVEKVREVSKRVRDVFLGGFDGDDRAAIEKWTMLESSGKYTGKGVKRGEMPLVDGVEYEVSYLDGGYVVTVCKARKS